MIRPAAAIGVAKPRDRAKGVAGEHLRAAVSVEAVEAIVVFRADAPDDRVGVSVDRRDHRRAVAVLAGAPRGRDGGR